MGLPSLEAEGMKTRMCTAQGLEESRTKIIGKGKGKSKIEKMERKVNKAGY